MAMCEQLAPIGKCMGPELTSTKILDELLELLKDEEFTVSFQAAIDLIRLVCVGMTYQVSQLPLLLVRGPIPTEDIIEKRNRLSKQLKMLSIVEGSDPFIC
jgi:hypothetical protein